MSLKRPPKPVSMTLNLAPMVDVMMCLIIFFLLASKIVAAENLRIDLPWAVAAKEVEQGDLGSRITVTVRRVNNGDDAAQYVVVDWDGKRIVERLLTPTELEAMLQVRALDAARDGRRLRCVVRADRQVQYRHVEVVLRGCGKAKIGDVVFSVNEGADPELPS